MNNHKWRLFLWPLCMLILTICMFLFPQATYSGARYGLETWALTLVPSLLPFMIAADILIEMGIVSFLGVLLEPLMRPLFRLPGAAGFAVAMGFTSGFPMGALLTASLYEKGLCSQNEATRLVTFTNNASPLFLLVAIPVTMLKAPELGWILLCAHYLANLLIGVLIGRSAPAQAESASQGHLLARSVAAFYATERPPLGAILGNAVSKGIKSILSIGGFVLFFSVIIQILDTVHLLALADLLFAQLLGVLALDTQLASSLSMGFLEMTLGTKAAATCAAPILQRLLLVSFILGWSGLSIHAQVGSIIAEAKIPLWPYILCRFCQGLLASGFTLLFFLLYRRTSTVLLPLDVPEASPLLGFTLNCQLTLAALLLLLTCALLLHGLRRLIGRLRS